MISLAAVLLSQGMSPVTTATAAPARVQVLPVFFVPKGQAEPSTDESQRLMRHVEWSQRRYKELLGGTHTFEIAPKSPVVYQATHELAYYRRQPQGAAPQIVAELLQYFRVDRATCSSVYLVIVMNPHDKFPNGGGRPINGGYGTGGGVVTLSTYALNTMPNFQSTLQHELGHSFGLPHVDVYGYDMNSNPSIMSYNTAHRTNGFEPSATPGALIPEDRRGLALNQRVFPGLRFVPERDVPKGYRLHAVVNLGPMDLPALAPVQ